MRTMFSYGVKILVSTNSYESIAFALNEHGEYSDEIACIRGSDKYVTEKDCINVVRGFTKKDLLQKLKVRMKHGCPNRRFAAVRRALATGVICEDGDMSIIEVTP